MNLRLPCLLMLLSGLLLGIPARADEAPIAKSPDKTNPLKVGAALPDVSVRNDQGQPVKLSTLHADGPVVLVFFRGSWCPICTRHFQDLIQIHPEIVKAGATLVAISPDTAENSKANAEKIKAPFPLMSDSDLAAAKAFGLAFEVDAATVSKYKGFGIDLQKASGRDHHALPIPAVYIVDKSGQITMAHSDPDYTKRLDGTKILEGLKKAP